MTVIENLREAMTRWLTDEIEDPRAFPLSDFERILYELRPCDVLLIEGRSRVSSVIKIITQSSWSHSALYIGRVHDIENKELRERVRKFYHGEADVQLIIESILGQGIIVSPLSKYKDDHIRICRPTGITRQDAQQVIGYAIGRLGMKYDVRQILDLARFLFPWSIMPRRWRSSLFTTNVGGSTKESCSSLLAEAFQTVGFPILPVLKRSGDAEDVELFLRSPKLYTPSDFDYSPFFEIIKYPILEMGDTAPYRKLHWKTGVVTDDDGRQYQARVSETPAAATTKLKTAATFKEPSAEKTEEKGKKPNEISEFFD